MKSEENQIVLDQFGKALERLKEALEEDREKNSLALDAAIQRFEFCYELCWKALKKVLQENGVKTTTPIDVFKKAYEYEFIDNEEKWLSMKNDRNLTSHTYKEDIALEIYERLYGYYEEMKSVYERLKG